jgi:hypothetical protein
MQLDKHWYEKVHHQSNWKLLILCHVPSEATKEAPVQYNVPSEATGKPLVRDCLKSKMSGCYGASL